MNGLSREQLLEKLNDLYIELDEYKDMKKDYIDLSYEMQNLEKVHGELEEKYDDLKWDYDRLKENYDILERDFDILMEKYKDDEFLIDVLKSRVEELEDELFSRDN